MLYNTRELNIEINKIMTIKHYLLSIWGIILIFENRNFRSLHFYFVLYKSLDCSPWFFLEVKSSRINPALQVITNRRDKNLKSQKWSAKGLNHHCFPHLWYLEIRIQGAMLQDDTPETSLPYISIQIGQLLTKISP